ncbi:MAG: sigma-70 family RNA polymerase sigma factor [Lachnospiraceae bacterium]|nr:sigma-70 family RNA polymerase sigma factor [Lachnospiraceae bacterium]
MTNELLVREIQQGNNVKMNMEQLYNQNKGMIYQLVKKYRNIDRMTDIDDLMNQAYIGLVDAVEHYNSDNDVLFMTYAPYRIGKNIKLYLDQCGHSMSLPIHMQHKIYKYNQAVGYFLATYNREPTDKELCWYLELTQKQLVSLRKTMHISAVCSIDSPINSDGEQLTIVDTIRTETDDMEAVEESIDREHLSFTLWDAVHEAVKNAAEISALELKYKDCCTLKETGEQLGVTSSRARNMHDRAMKKCRTNRKIIDIGQSEGLQFRCSRWAFPYR